MIFGNKTRIEEYIVEILDSSPLGGSDLLEKIVESYGPTTKQSVYKALRKLVEDEILTKQGTYYSLNRYWLQKIRQFSQRHIAEPESVDISNILSFEDGDSVAYVFKSPFLMDIVWAHLYDILYEANPTHYVMLNYHPHEWLALSRPDTEKYWLSRFSQDKKMMFFSIGGTTFLDKKFKKENSSEYIEINLGESYNLKPNDYLAVVGDYVFEITTDERFEKTVHEFFKNSSGGNEVDQKNHSDIKIEISLKVKIE